MQGNSYVSGGSYLVVLVYYNVLGLMIYNTSIHVHTWILTLYSRSIHSNTSTYKDTVHVPSAANNTTTNNNSVSFAVRVVGHLPNS